MAESSRFWTTNDTGDGPLAGYTMTDFLNLLRRLLTPDAEDSQGVLRGVGNELAVTGTSSPLSMASGAAIAYGFFYENSAALSLAVSTPVVGTTGGRVNLKVDWLAQIVRAVVQLNTDGIADIPALVQTAGVEWNLPRYTFTITTAGAISLTYVGAYCQFADYITVDMIQAVTGLSVIGRASNSAGAAGVITADADGELLVRNGTSLEFGKVNTAGIANLAVDTGQLAAGAVTDAKAGERVPKLDGRQGGSATHWATTGNSNYTPDAVDMQTGAKQVSISNGQGSGSATVTFPAAFAYNPIVFLTIYSTDGSVLTLAPRVTAISTTGFTIQIDRPTTSGAVTVTVNWLAAGPS